MPEKPEHILLDMLVLLGDVTTGTPRKSKSNFAKNAVSFFQDFVVWDSSHFFVESCLLSLLRLLGFCGFYSFLACVASLASVTS